MATVAFPRSAHGVPPRSHGVLTGDWLRGHGALTACSWRAKSCHCASTACTQRARRALRVSTASSRSVYEHMRKVLQSYCRNRHAYKRELSDVIYCLIFVEVDIGNLCFIYLFYVIISNAGEDRHITAMMLAISEIIQSEYRHTAHTIVSWPSPKQWVIIHTSDLLMIIRQSIYHLNHHKGDWQTENTQPHILYNG